MESEKTTQREKVGMVNLKVIMALGGWSLAGGTTVRRKFALFIGMVLFKTTEVVFNTDWRLALMWAGGHNTGPSYVVQGEAFDTLYPSLRTVRSFIEYFGEIWAKAVAKRKKGAHFKSIMKELMLLIAQRIEGVDQCGDEDAAWHRVMGFMKYMQTHYDKLMTATEALAKRSWKKEITQQQKIKCQAKYDRACERFNAKRNQYLKKMECYEKVTALVDTAVMDYGTILYNCGASQWQETIAPCVSTWIRYLAAKWEYITDEGPVFTTSQIVHLVMGLKHQKKAMIEDAVKVEEVLVITEEDEKELLVEEEGPKCGCFTNIFRRFV